MNLFTLVHVLISLIGIFSGIVAVSGLVAGRLLPHWTLLFLISTVATSVTGFFFPFHHFTPAHGLGIISLVVLAVSLVAFYAKHLLGSWRRIYAISAVLALYLNFFVLVVQSFEKVPALHALAPTQAEPPFVVAQSITLVVFIGLGVLSALRFHSSDVRTGSSSATAIAK